MMIAATWTTEPAKEMGPHWHHIHGPSLKPLLLEMTEEEARLLACAPEMLYALELLMPVLDRVKHLAGETWGLDEDEAVQEAKRVITKTTARA